MTPPLPWELLDLDQAPAHAAAATPAEEALVMRSIESRGGPVAVAAFQRLERLARTRLSVNPDRDSNRLAEIDRQCEAIVREQIPYLPEAMREARVEMEAFRAAAAPALPPGDDDVPPP